MQNNQETMERIKRIGDELIQTQEESMERIKRIGDELDEVTAALESLVLKFKELGKRYDTPGGEVPYQPLIVSPAHTGMERFQD